MGAFGERLRREREMRGVSLDEISAATKIGTRLLRAVEDEQFDLLPGGIFNKGFVRAYAKYLGIDEEAAVADYLSASGHGDPDLRVLAAQTASGSYNRADTLNTSPSRPASFPFIPVLILIVVVTAASGAWHIYQDRQRNLEVKQKPAQSVSPAATAPAPETTPGSASDGQSSAAEAGQKPTDADATSAKTRTNTEHVHSAPPGKTATTPQNPAASAKAADLPSKDAPSSGGVPAGNLIAAATSAETSGTPFEIIVKAKDRAWVSIKSDGKIMVRGIIKPPDVKTIHANDQVVFWTGNAGDVQVSFNGREVPLSGGQNQERVLVFNSRGLLSEASQ